MNIKQWFKCKLIAPTTKVNLPEVGTQWRIKRDDPFPPDNKYAITTVLEVKQDKNGDYWIRHNNPESIFSDSRHKLDTFLYIFEPQT